MSNIVTAFKNLLGVKGFDQEDDTNLAMDIRAYTEMISSSKYADSNANTDDLEKLIRAIQLNDTNQLESVPKPSEPSDKGRLLLAAAQQQPAEEDHDGQAQDPRFGLRFLDRLTSHLDLLEVLEGEGKDQLLPGQPVYKPAKFGKEGGTNFVLKQFKSPSFIYGAMLKNNTKSLGLNSPMTIDNYVQRFQNLLWLEEIHQAAEMRRYDMHNVMLARFDGNLLELQVPGLAEGRPSLMRGDRLILRNDGLSAIYEGYIHDVRERDILFKLHENLHTSKLDGLKYNVQFLSSRTPFRRSHHGVSQLYENSQIKSIVFPNAKCDNLEPIIDVKESSYQDFRCFQRELNTHQRKAVINILKSKNRPAPYIIFGPPGTGKTVTLVEAVLQVYARKKDSKILVVGNSNSCADLLAKRIQDSGIIPSDRFDSIVRISAFYRMEKLVPPELEEMTKDMEMISTEMYRNYRIVITTCIQSGVLYEFRERFDYVFIDEAGHASEPESLISIGLLKPRGSVVLAGDPHQLGPVCVSPMARDHGLAESLLERLSRRAIYQRKVMNSKMTYDECFITKLIICYRSDPRVLAVNNKLFYHNELKFVVKTPERWMRLFSFHHPLVFHAVKGKDRREYLNPSWFNPNEAISCLTYAKRLYDSGLKPEQLGIITPYRRQIEKLNILFESCHLPLCKISTMEEFQGDEREIIIISTVRTREKNLEFDKRFRLGFLLDPKRFNVAISRAKWMVIVVGDPSILKKDPCWVEYLNQAQKIGMEQEA